MRKEFADIAITGIDDAASKPIAETSLVSIALKLSGSPPPEWADYFNAAWRNHLYMMKRRVHVAGSMLRIDCVPEELEAHHLEELKKVIAETNSAYRQYDAQRQRERESREARENEAVAKVRELKNRIKFD